MTTENPSNTSEGLTEAPRGSEGLTKRDVYGASYILRLRAEYFVQDEWQYTRNSKIVHIIQSDEFKGRRAPLKRLKRFADYTVGMPLRAKFLKNKPDWERQLLRDSKFGFRDLKIFSKLALFDPIQPDGSLADGTVITFWEEIGEYLQLVQPSTGSILAEFLHLDPMHPSAQKLAKQILDIEKRYAERVGYVYDEMANEDIREFSHNGEEYLIVVEKIDTDIKLFVHVLSLGYTTVDSEEMLDEQVRNFLDKEAR